MTSAAQDHDQQAFPPSAEFAATANAGPELQAAADADRLAFWDTQAQRLDWATPFTQVLDWSEAPVAKWFVGGKLNVAYNCVDRHVEAGNGDRVAIALGGRTRRLPRPDLRRPARRGVEGREHLHRPRTGHRRPRRDLHADDPRGDHRDAGVRPARPDALRRVRRLLRHRTALPHRRRRGQAAHHHRRPVPPRQGGPAQDCRRRRGLRSRVDPARAGGQAHRHRRRVDRRPRSVVARDGRRRPPPNTRPRRSTPSTRCSCSTPRAPPESPRASCTPPAAT